VIRGQSGKESKRVGRVVGKRKVVKGVVGLNKREDRGWE